MRCTEIREMLPAHDEEGGSTLALKRHLASCDACREELAHYENLRSTMSSMRHSSIDAPPGLFSALVAIPETEQSRVAALKTHVERNRRAYASGLAALAGAGAVALWRARRSRLATA